MITYDTPEVLHTSNIIIMQTYYDRIDMLFKVIASYMHEYSNKILATEYKCSEKVISID